MNKIYRNQESVIKRLERLPVPVLPTMVGAATLSNVYATLGFIWVRHLSMWAAALVVLAYLGKLLLYPRTCLHEYQNTVPASLYAALTMASMILGSYIFEYQPGIGKAIWFAALLIHAVHILVFTYRNVLKSRSSDTFVPSWFVTYNGIMVSCVVGGGMNERKLLTAVVYYGIAVYFILIPMMIYRLKKYEIKDGVVHTLAVLMAPCSLCVVSYLNIIEQPLLWLAAVLYICMLLSLIFVLSRIPKFFSYPFSPAFAGLTFPMAIGIVASTKMSGYLSQLGMEQAAGVVKQISGIQIYVATAVIGFVLYHFLRLLFGAEVKN